MMNRFDAAEGFEFLLGARAVRTVERLQVAVDELDCFKQTARRLGFPNLAEAAAPQPLDELVAGDRLRMRFNPERHVQLPRKMRKSRRILPSCHTTRRCAPAR